MHGNVLVAYAESSGRGRNQHTQRTGRLITGGTCPLTLNHRVEKLIAKNRAKSSLAVRQKLMSTIARGFGRKWSHPLHHAQGSINGRLCHRQGSVGGASCSIHFHSSWGPSAFSTTNTTKATSQPLTHPLSPSSRLPILAPTRHPLTALPPRNIPCRMTCCVDLTLLWRPWWTRLTISPPWSCPPGRRLPRAPGGSSCCHQHSGGDR